ncbi:MAG: 30S ribosomal protein S20, partial [Proteobacteria bacterium]|nr:30S ribosomal protein S20 [Pseudomonadota bacterium]
TIDKAATKGIIHKRNAARKTSRLTRNVNALKS